MGLTAGTCKEKKYWTFINLKPFPCRQKMFRVSYVCSCLKWTKYVENWIQLFVVIEHNMSEYQQNAVYDVSGFAKSSEYCYFI